MYFSNKILLVLIYSALPFAEAQSVYLSRSVMGQAYGADKLPVVWGQGSRVAGVPTQVAFGYDKLISEEPMSELGGRGTEQC